MVSVVVFEFSVMRCQPLRRALVSLRKDHQKFTPKVLKIQLLAFKLHNWTFKFGLMLIWSNVLKVQ
ncbi:acetyltransferase [Vibrio cholerae]|nr:acetyltransferase [Vibrio cholerae]